MNFTKSLLEKLADKHLLKHGYYQAWTRGELTKEDLRRYAGQYFHHVSAFPRYISAAHSLCKDITSRQVLLQNLTDEEKGEKHHPELWLRFAEGMGATREEIENGTLLPETQNLIDTFFKYARSSYAEGLGVLFAYEQQVPEVAASKIEGLKKFYGIDDARTLEFFEVHLKADVYHSQAAAELMENLSPAEREKAQIAAEAGANALWKFLDGQERMRKAS